MQCLPYFPGRAKVAQNLLSLKQIWRERKKEREREKRDGEVLDEWPYFLPLHSPTSIKE